MSPRACVVEVVEQVAEADVAIVAARVGERLAMAPERVRKLIEGRTGPITRALRADKADAIAQTFEAAGVRVVIRPAEPEELEDLPGAVTRNTAERAAEFDAPEPDDELHEPAHDAEADDDDDEAEVGYDEDEDEDEAEFAELERQPDQEPDEPVPEAEAARLGAEPEGGAPDLGALHAHADDALDPEAKDLGEPDPDAPQPEVGGHVGDGDDPDSNTDEGGVIEVDDDARASGGDPTSSRSKFTSTGEWVAGDVGVWSTTRPPRSADVWLPEDGVAEAPIEVVDEDVDDDAGAPPPPSVGRNTRRPRGVVVPVRDGSESRRVPFAWRGLGPEPAGPARPVNAPLPRRRDPEAPIEVPDPRRWRRGTLLVLLAIAVAAFLVSQWWVASRAGAAVDASAGIHAYRDGDFAAARRYWGAQAGAGDPAAQFMLGYLAEAGLGAPWSARAAAAWYRAAADGGHAEAAWRLGRLYEAGLGVAPDDGEARRWFRAAADLGHGEAAFALGRSWMRELGVVWVLEGTATWPVAMVEELSAAFARAADLGFHEAAPYAASLAAARAAGLP